MLALAAVCSAAERIWPWWPRENPEYVVIGTFRTGERDAFETERSQKEDGADSYWVWDTGSVEFERVLWGAAGIDSVKIGWPGRIRVAIENEGYRFFRSIPSPETPRPVYRGRWIWFLWKDHVASVGAQSEIYHFQQRYLEKLRQVVDEIEKRLGGN